MEKIYTAAEIDSLLSDFAKNSDVDSKLMNYALHSDVELSLMNYDTSGEINSRLLNYVTNSELSASLESISSPDLSPYSLKSEVNDALKSYIKTSELSTATVASAGTAIKLSSPRTIQILGNATGSASFDGSEDCSISVTVNRALTAGSADSCTSTSYAERAGTATTSFSATRAEHDGEGNKISSQYAAKSELNNLAARLPSFSFANGILTISDGRNTYRFVGEVV